LLRYEGIADEPVRDEASAPDFSAAQRVAVWLLVAAAGWAVPIGIGIALYRLAG
jgi:hypothetical protein